MNSNLILGCCHLFRAKSTDKFELHHEYQKKFRQYIKLYYNLKIKFKIGGNIFYQNDLNRNHLYYDINFK